MATDTLFDRVWGDDLPGDVRGSLYACVRRLRAVLGDDAISNDSGRYTLHAEPDAVDALRFTRLLDQARIAPPADEQRLVREALALWRGTPFDEPLSDWLNLVETRRLTDRHLAAVQHRIDADLAEGRHAEVVAELQELTATHPLREPLWARLLIALDKVGRPAEALDAYERIRVRLADELGIDPSPELRELHAALLAGTPVVPASAGTPAVVVPQQLPASISGFTGRSTVLRLLDKHLAEAGGPDHQLEILALHGLGGIGKTTLALHWAHQVRGEFPDGQLFVDLRGFGPGEPLSPATALDILLCGLGVPGNQIPADIDGRSSMFRSLLAGRRVLLVLDNARGAEQVRPLLPGSGSVVLVTSRGQLRGLAAREGARRIAVDTLSEAEAEALLLSRLGDLHAPGSAADLSELARACGYLPLALVIAAERAARQATGGLHSVVAELRDERDRLAALDAGDDETTNLRAVFSWSYQALDADTARMFRLLGLPPGTDISAPAAAALAGTSLSKARGLLDRLVDRSLIDQRAGGRFQLHDHVRAYAAELAEAHDGEDERRAAIVRLFDWLVHSTAAAKRALNLDPPLVPSDAYECDIEPMAFADSAQAAAWRDAEMGTLIAAVYAATVAGHHQATYRLVQAVWSPGGRAAPADEMLRLTTLAVDAARAAGEVQAEAHVSNLLGLAHRQLADFGTGHTHFEHALALFEHSKHERGQIAALANLCANCVRRGQHAEAADYAQRSLALARRTGNSRELTTPLNHLAYAYLATHRYDEAAEACLQAIEIHRQLARHDEEVSVLDTLGLVRLAQGRPDDAAECFQPALQYFVEAGNRWAEGAVLVNVGRAQLALGHPDRARAAWEQAVHIFDEVRAGDEPEFSRTELVQLLADLPPAAAAQR